MSDLIEQAKLYYESARHSFETHLKMHSYDSRKKWSDHAKWCQRRAAYESAVERADRDFLIQLADINRRFEDHVFNTQEAEEL